MHKLGGGGGEKSTVKVKFEVTLKSIAGLATSTKDAEVFLVWKRGSKKGNKGETKRAPLTAGAGDKIGALFNETITLQATMLHYERLKRFDKKPLDLTLKEVEAGSKKSKDLAALEINLGDFAANGTNITKDFKFSKVKGSGSQPVLSMHIKAEWMKINGKKIVKKGGTEEGQDDYDLVTDDEGSDASEISEIESDAESDAGSDASDSDWGEDSDSERLKAKKEKRSSSSLDKNAFSTDDEESLKKALEEEEKKMQAMEGIYKKLRKREKEKKKLLEIAKRDKKRIEEFKRENEELKLELERVRAQPKSSDDRSQLATDSDKDEQAATEASKLRADIEVLTKAAEEAKRELGDQSKTIEFLRMELESTQQASEVKTQAFEQLKKEFLGLEQLKEELDKVRKEAEEWRREAENKTQEYERLAGEAKEKATQLEEVTKQLQVVRDESQQQLSEAQDKGRTVDKLEKELEEAKLQAESARREAEDRGKELDEKAGHIERLAKELEEAKLQAESARREAEDRSKELDEKAGYIERLAKELAESRNEAEEKKKEVDSLRSEVSSIQTAIKDAESMADTARRDAEEKAHEIERLTKSKDACVSELEEKRRELENLLKNEGNRDGLLESIRENLKEKEDELVRLRQELEKRDTTIAETGAKLVELQNADKELGQVKQQLAEMESSLRARDQRIVELAKVQEDLLAVRQQLEVKQIFLDSINGQHAAELQKVKDEVEEARQQVAEKESLLASKEQHLTVTLQAKDEELNAVRKMLTDRGDSDEEKDKQIRELKDALEATQASSEEKKKEVDEAKRQLEELQSKLSQVEAKLATSNAALEAKTSELAENERRAAESEGKPVAVPTAVKGDQQKGGEKGNVSKNERKKFNREINSLKEQLRRKEETEEKSRATIAQLQQKLDEQGKQGSEVSATEAAVKVGEGENEQKKSDFKNRLEKKLQQGEPKSGIIKTLKPSDATAEARPDDKEDKKAAFKKNLALKLAAGGPTLPGKRRPSSDSQREARIKEAEESQSEIVRPTGERLISLSKDRPMQSGKRLPTRIGGSTIRRNSEEYTKLQQELEAKNAEIEALKGQLASHETAQVLPSAVNADEVAQLRKELEDLRKEKEKIEKELHEKDEELQLAQSKHQEMAQLPSLSISLSSLAEKLHEEEVKVTAREATIESQRQKLTELEQQLEEANQRSAEVSNSKQQSFEADLEKLRTQLAWYENRDREGQIEEDQLWTKRIAEVKAELDAKMHELEQTKQELATARSEADVRIKELETRLATAEAELSNLRSGHEREGDERAEALKNELLGKETTIASAQQKIDELETAIRSEKQRWNEEQTKLQSAFEAERTRAKHLEDEIKQLSAKREASDGKADDSDREDMKDRAKLFLAKLRDDATIERLIYGNINLGDESGESDEEDNASDSKAPESRSSPRTKKAPNESDAQKQAQRIFEFLLERAAFDNKHGAELLNHVATALRSAINLGPRDLTVQCRWLSILIHLVHFIKNDEYLADILPSSALEALDDPMKRGIKILKAQDDDTKKDSIKKKTRGKTRVSPKWSDDESDEDKPSRDNRANLDFLRDIQLTTVSVYKNVLSGVQKDIEPLLLPAILAQPASVFSNSATSLGSSSQDRLHECLKSVDDITNTLDNFVETLRKANLPRTVIRQAIVQMFYWIDVMLFYYLTKTENLCTCSNGFQIKYGLAELGQWFHQASIAHYIDANTARAMLSRSNEAVMVLMMDRSIFSNEDAVREVFPNLNPVQLLHLLDAFRPDEVSSAPVPTEAKQLLARMASKARATMFLQFDSSALLPYEDPSTP